MSIILTVSAIAPVCSAQPAPYATGSITGRVMNSAGESSLGRVRVTVEGTSLETFTDAGGAYRLDGVPAGTRQVKLFHTGLTPHIAAVTAAATQTAPLDVTMTLAAG